MWTFFVRKYRFSLNLFGCLWYINSFEILQKYIKKYALLKKVTYNINESFFCLMCIVKLMYVR